jgi:hypothetical protein
MRKYVNRLLGCMAIVFAMLLLGSLHNSAFACHSGADASKSLHDASTSVQRQKIPSRRTTSNKSRGGQQEESRHVSASHHAIIDKLHERQSQQHNCPISKSLCCFNCPNEFALSVMQTRPHDAITIAVNWPTSLLRASSLRALSLEESGPSVSEPPPRAPILSTPWRSVLLMATARLRI